MAVRENRVCGELYFPTYKHLTSPGDEERERDLGSISRFTHVSGSSIGYPKFETTFFPSASHVVPANVSVSQPIGEGVKARYDFCRQSGPQEQAFS